VDRIIELVMAAPPRTLTIVVTGPMTNIAVALRREPAIAARIGRIVAMGGARSAGGNITASAEFNIFADPHAARIVLTSGVDVVLFGLDVTHQVRAEERHIAAIEAIGNPRAEAAAKLLRFSDGIMRAIDPALGAPLHDPCTIAWLIRPALFRFRAATVDVETGSALTLGHTAVEFRKPANHQWATHADADAVFALLTERLA
jgi:purine nucleosidase